ncbi:MAG: hypothetical protein NC912_04860 [Candidatus Omnitrophica bacterium]|nr:hypothetical protein [Candidatus Omnitrophota bacterium]
MDYPALLINWLIMIIPLKPVLFIFSLISLGTGIFLICKPELALRIQQGFYAKINWRLEPISLEKELRNTRIMGGFLVLAFLVILFLILRN